MAAWAQATPTNAHVHSEFGLYILPLTWTPPAGLSTDQGQLCCRKSRQCLGTHVPRISFSMMKASGVWLIATIWRLASQEGYSRPVAVRCDGIRDGFERLCSPEVPSITARRWLLRTMCERYYHGFAFRDVYQQMAWGLVDKTALFPVGKP